MIDYNKIAASIEHYGSYGFKRIESPWTVTKAIADMYMTSSRSIYNVTTLKQLTFSISF